MLMITAKLSMQQGAAHYVALVTMIVMLMMVLVVSVNVRISSLLTITKAVNMNLPTTHF